MKSYKRNPALSRVGFIGFGWVSHTQRLKRNGFVEPEIQKS